MEKLLKYLNSDPKFEVRETGKYGKGIFAKRDISKGEIITKFTGEIITLKEDLKRVRKGEMRNDDGFQIGEEKYLALDPIPILFNHSCSPNAAFRKKSELFAIKNIKKGEEITYDYSSTAGSNITDKMWTMSCKCGSPNCRKLLGNVLTIPKNVLKRYKKMGALQDYIIDELNNNKT